MRVRIQTEPSWTDGRRVAGSLFDGREGELVHTDVDDRGFFGLVDVDGYTDGPALRFDLRSIETIGGEW